MVARRLPVAALLILLVSLVLVVPATAAAANPPVGATVRVEAKDYEVCPSTAVRVEAGQPVIDSLGNIMEPGHASALAALMEAADLRGFTVETAYGGDFVTTIAGFTSLPDWSNGWVYSVNGSGYPVVDVGALTFALRQRDEVVFAQYPDPTFTAGTQLLVVEAQPGTLVTPGTDVTFTILGDDVAHPDSDADKARFASDASVIDADHFPVVTGATLHVGSQVLVDGAGGDALDGQITVNDMVIGTSMVWAEKEMDAGFTYVRSPRTLVNAGPEMTMTDITQSRAAFTPGRPRGNVAVGFSLSKACAVTLKVRRRGAAAAVYRHTWHFAPDGGTTPFAAGCRWWGRTTAGQRVPAGTYVLKLTAADGFGRRARGDVTVRVRP